MDKKDDSNEIDLLKVFQIFWDEKIKIFLIIILTIFIALGFQNYSAKSNKINTKFSTRIKTISILDEAQYQDLNIVINKYTQLSKTFPYGINKNSLLDIFLTILKEEKYELIKEFNFIKREDYKSEKQYQSMINRLSNSIIIAKMELKLDKFSVEQITNAKLTKEKEFEGIIEFSSNNQDFVKRWTDFIEKLEDNINEIAQNYINEVIRNSLEYAQKTRKNEIDDIQREIENSIINYELEKNSRLSFLEEQARIAREGNVQSEIMTPSGFGSNYSINYSLNSIQSLYYLKGYQVIEKEIELINNRKNPILFVRGLPSLQAKKNAIEQKQDIIREQATFERTPIASDNNFRAGSIESTRTITMNNNIPMNKIVIFAILLGLGIAIFFILISRAFNKENNLK